MVCSRQSRQSCMLCIFTCTHFYMHFAGDTDGPVQACIHACMGAVFLRLRSS